MCMFALNTMAEINGLQSLSEQQQQTVIADRERKKAEAIARAYAEHDKKVADFAASQAATKALTTQKVVESKPMPQEDVAKVATKLRAESPVESKRKRTFQAGDSGVKI